MLSAPLFTSFANDIGDLDLVPRSLYICGHSNEERSRHTDEWEARFADVSFAYVHPDGPFRATVTIDSRSSTSVTLRSESELNEILMRPCYSAVYLDITGLLETPHLGTVSSLDPDECPSCLRIVRRTR